MVYVFVDERLIDLV